MSFRHHLVRWEADYAKAGLAILEISGGKPASLEYSRKTLGVREVCHAILWDQDNRNHTNYGIRSWPTAYLIGADGTVFWEGNPAWTHGRPEDLDNLKMLLEAQLRAAQNTRSKNSP